MIAVIFAAGLGLRLRQITNEVPKCMVPVNYIWIIDKLLKAGLTDIYVVSGYLHKIHDLHLKENFPMVTKVANTRYYQTNDII